jgi:hypothetical protein
MSIKCSNCQKGITTMKFSDASVITSGKQRVPAPHHTGMSAL